MKALKSARDQINVGSKIELMLIMSDPEQAAKNALDALRQQIPSLVWKSARGEYAVDDVAMHRWYQQRVAAGKLPPQGTLE
ncbi:MAG: hypothetical protein LBU53_05075 [Zoogloeaceae bacterium]|jgi:hypothetical protein|nr:hypothetical protein [Zoogloeaceae bacterium]